MRDEQRARLFEALVGRNMQEAPDATRLILEFAAAQELEEIEPIIREIENDAADQALRSARFVHGLIRA